MLIEMHGFGKIGDFQTKEVVEMSKISKSKSWAKFSNKIRDLRSIATCDENVININK